MIIKRAAFGYDKISNLDAVKKVLSAKPITTVKSFSKIVPLVDKLNEATKIIK